MTTHILLHENIENKLNYFYDNREIPHIIFHGNSGSGKKTIVQRFIQKIYRNNKAVIKENVMYVNCSHGKGIKFIRDDLKFFAKTNLQLNQGIQFKTIVLYNADFLTIDAQSALRRCIELFSNNTRFFIVVENKNKLLNPILSRFCEIYVPDFPMNLHQYNIQHTMNFHQEDAVQQEWIYNAFFSKKMPNGIFDSTPENLASPSFSVNPTHSGLIELAERFYENGISCLDFIRMMKNMNESVVDSKLAHTHEMSEKIIELCMFFYKIKSEFRCEKMLLFSLFEFYFYGSSELLVRVSK